MALRTAEEFDDWFRRSGGDPWDYDSPHVQERLRTSLEFIVSHVGEGFTGTFVEMGAFRGQFTKWLAPRFPDASVLATDISPLAIQSARATLTNFHNVQLACADMATFEPPAGLAPPIYLLLMECFYYLPKAERFGALDRLVRRLHRPEIFISCPITGGTYFRTRELVSLFRQVGYRRSAQRPLTYRFWLVGKTVDQAIYLFSPK